ncbi:TPA: hypothetical protein I9092_003143 [Clostridium perfringens]|uniref:hypothetical protein n=1 Tax=Clostridium TaxID=1485 RepID=UPI0012421B59|nr:MULTISPECIES: hypothetical protein [Clostridium]EGT3620201.1 hypothetical protein [Clostridium perfringens]USQ66426.1 hypothetical protein GOM42_15475 [Clostridium sp. 16K-1-R1]HAT4337642.1 hypothetical protein [Clostridium perfringens]
MNYADISLIIIMCIVNTLFLYKVIKNKKNLSMNSYTVISLGSSNDKIMDKLIIPYLFFNYILILLYTVISEFFLIFLIIYMPIMFLSLPIIYVSNDYIGTLVRGVDTRNIDFIEINVHVEYIEVVFKYKNEVYKKLKYRLSILRKNKEIEVNKFIDTLKEYGYKIYVKTFN